jgi:hypothetical protein
MIKIEVAVKTPDNKRADSKFPLLIHHKITAANNPNSPMENGNIKKGCI